MESVYHIVTIRVNETSWVHVWRLRFRYLETGYDNIVVVLHACVNECAAMIRLTRLAYPSL
jgi:hypothetical protein